jgi:hypothetical protein
MDENQIQSAQTPTAQTQVAPEALPLLTQDHMNKVVAREKLQAREAGRREAEEKYQRDLEALNAAKIQQEQQNSNVSRNVDVDGIYQQIQERQNKDRIAQEEAFKDQQLKQHMTQVASNHDKQMSEGRSAYEDFDEVMKGFDPTKFPELVYLVAGIQNGGDILYDLQKNPTKLATLDRFAERNPRQAQDMLLKLSQSIKDNKQGQTDAQSQTVSEPLAHLKSSRVSGSNGKMSIKDLRNQPWLKG